MTDKKNKKTDKKKTVKKKDVPRETIVANLQCDAKISCNVEISYNSNQEPPLRSEILEFVVDNKDNIEFVMEELKMETANILSVFNKKDIGNKKEMKNNLISAVRIIEAFQKGSSEESTIDLIKSNIKATADKIPDEENGEEEHKEEENGKKKDSSTSKKSKKTKKTEK